VISRCALYLEAVQLAHGDVDVLYHVLPLPPVLQHDHLAFEEAEGGEELFLDEKLKGLDVGSGEKVGVVLDVLANAICLVAIGIRLVLLGYPDDGFVVDALDSDEVEVGIVFPVPAHDHIEHIQAPLYELI
jgi:hypothetical protein